MGLLSLQILTSFSAGSDFRCKILTVTSKVDPSAERVKQSAFGIVWITIWDIMSMGKETTPGTICICLNSQHLRPYVHV